MGKPLADYVKLPELEEYKEWFKNFTSRRWHSSSDMENE